MTCLSSELLGRTEPSQKKITRARPVVRVYDQKVNTRKKILNLNGLAYGVSEERVERVCDFVHRRDGQAGGVAGDQDLGSDESPASAVAST
jgi:hypothetical protein